MNSYDHIISNYNYDIIKLTNENDIKFSNIAQMAKVTNTTLPSGFKVPESNNGDWIIYKNFIINVPEKIEQNPN